MRRYTALISFIGIMFASAPGWGQDGIDFGTKIESIVDWSYHETEPETYPELMEFRRQYFRDFRKSELAVSPDGVWLAFKSMEGNIWIVPTMGGEPQLLFNNPLPGKYSFADTRISMCFSHDSQEVIFTNNRYDTSRGSIVSVDTTFYADGSIEDISGNYMNEMPRIEAINIHNYAQRVLVEDASYPSISFDGQYLVYVRFDPMIYLDESQAYMHGVPFVLNIATEKKFPLLDLKEQYTWAYIDPSSDTDRRKVGIQYMQSTIAPDNSHIIIEAKFFDENTIPLYRISLGGGEPVLLTRKVTSGIDGRYRLHPQYSPDGSWLMYNSSQPGEGWKLWEDCITPQNDHLNMMFVAIDTEAHNSYFLFPDAFLPPYHGVWSADGQYLYYLLNDPVFFYQEYTNGGTTDFFLARNRVSIYQVQFSTGGFWEITPTGTDAVEPPSFRLTGNHPNPFNSETTITYSLSSPSKVDLRIYSVTGQQVRTLDSELHGAGTSSSIWDGRNDLGVPVASGMYYAVMRSDLSVQAHPLTFIK